MDKGNVVGLQVCQERDRFKRIEFSFCGAVTTSICIIVFVSVHVSITRARMALVSTSQWRYLL